MSADLERAKALYPSVALDTAAWVAFFDTPAGFHAMGRVIGDIYAEITAEEEKEKGIQRRGRRPRPKAADWSTVYRAVFPQDYSLDPFPVAFREILTSRNLSLRNFATRVPVHFSTLSRLLNGLLEPDLAMLATIAEGARVKPGYFVEYRAKYLASMVDDTMTNMPHIGLTVMKQLQQDREQAG